MGRGVEVEFEEVGERVLRGVREKVKWIFGGKEGRDEGGVNEVDEGVRGVGEDVEEKVRGSEEGVGEMESGFWGVKEEVSERGDERREGLRGVKKRVEERESVREEGGRKGRGGGGEGVMRKW